MSNSQPDFGFRSAPNCARCRNHDVQLPVKSHKRYCKFRFCACNKCLLTAERQKVMARQTAVRRAEEQDRHRLKQGLPVPNGSDPPSHSVSGIKSTKEEWDSILLLLKWCNLPVSVTPLLHILLSEVSSNAHTIYSRFKESQEVLQKTCLSKPLQVLTPFSCAPYYPTVRYHPYLTYHHAYQLPVLPSLESFPIPEDTSPPDMKTDISLTLKQPSHFS
ncbi:doublesex- and mab-3-related transcription factor A2-like [Macrosteles quadrilineatus]|uniref:doublesex- and mab-3-related transcription factor A2-like n=1 Tax=Macrosteles quadrilineatus TaxID=74068 RepID=UPI0023E26101|nr:doublesex- and mab-3-related transcription factor A2-like [Macrosteles quadrilineatus]